MSSSARSLRPGGGQPWLGLAAPLAGQEDLVLQPEVARETSPWQLLKEERNKNKVLQLENDRLRKSLEIYQRSLEAKSGELEAKNKLLNKLMEEGTDVDPDCLVEDTIEIEQLLQANLGGELLTSLLEEGGVLDSSLGWDLPSSSTGLEEGRGLVGQLSGQQANKPVLPPIILTPSPKGFTVKRRSIEPPGGKPQGTSKTLTCPHCTKQFPRGGAWKMDQHIASTHKAASQKKEHLSSSFQQKIPDTPHGPKFLQKKEPSPKQGKVLSVTRNQKEKEQVTAGLPKKNKCQECGETFSHKSSLIGHRTHHLGTAPWKCAACHLPLPSLLQWMKHVRSKHGVTSSSQARGLLLPV